jgi:hypothetical protein
VTVTALVRRLRAGELSPVEAVGSALERIEALDGRLNAFISLRAEEALAEAELAQRSSGRGPLWGVPLAVKDVIDVAGTPTTAGSRILADNRPAGDAEVVTRLRRAGAIVVGKLNTHEFAYGATTTSAHFGRACNPWALDRVCGGSSGGSGAAVAAGLVPAALEAAERRVLRCAKEPAAQEASHEDRSRGAIRDRLDAARRSPCTRRIRLCGTPPPARVDRSSTDHLCCFGHARRGRLHGRDSLGRPVSVSRRQRRSGRRRM